MVTRIGYLVPEFPGQTHTWIWRERRALEERGIEVDLISTRRPKLACHSWSEEAIARTHYLFPPRVDDAAGAVQAFAQAGARRIGACLSRWIDAQDLSWKDRAKWLGLLGVAAGLAHRARARGWRQLHVLSCGDAAVVGCFASLLSGVDYSITLLASLEGYGANQRLKWQDASFGLVMSRKLQAELQRELGPQVPPRIAIAPMGVDVDQARRTKAYEPARPGDTLRVYTCGRLHPVKGHRYLFDAVGRLKREGRRVELVVAGAEEGVVGYRDELLALLDRDGLAGQVRLLGPVSEERHRAALEHAHVFVLASLDEGISVAAMEAMALETPTIATDVGGMRELIEPGVDGLMVPPADAAALASAIARIADSPELARQLSAASRRKVESQFHHRRGAWALADYLGIPPVAA